MPHRTLIADDEVCVARDLVLVAKVRELLPQPA